MRKGQEAVIVFLATCSGIYTLLLTNACIKQEEREVCTRRRTKGVCPPPPNSIQQYTEGQVPEYYKSPLKEETVSIPEWRAECEIPRLSQNYYNANWPAYANCCLRICAADFHCKLSSQLPSFCTFTFIKIWCRFLLSYNLALITYLPDITRIYSICHLLIYFSRHFYWTTVFVSFLLLLWVTESLMRHSQ